MGTSGTADFAVIGEELSLKYEGHGGPLIYNPGSASSSLDTPWCRVRRVKLSNLIECNQYLLILVSAVHTLKGQLNFLHDIDFILRLSFYFGWINLKLKWCSCWRNQ